MESEAEGNNNHIHLRQLLGESRSIQALGVHDGLTARIAERAGAEALWASGLTVSLSHAVPDAGILTMSEFLNAARTIESATALPVIADCDTGFGDIHSVVRTVREYEQAGISAVSIEDAAYPRRNSFWGTAHQLMSAEQFAARITLAKAAQKTESFMVIARLESFIAGEGLNEALNRGLLYAQAGADMILVHSKSRDGADVFEFADEWRSLGSPQPLVAVPTRYSSVSVPALEEAGIRLIIWANQITRGAISAMEQVAATLVRDRTPTAIEPDLSSMSDLFDLCGFDEMSAVESAHQELVQKYKRTHASRPSPLVAELRNRNGTL